jgi:hypothetical protein
MFHKRFRAPLQVADKPNLGEELPYLLAAWRYETARSCQYSWPILRDHWHPTFDLPILVTIYSLCFGDCWLTCSLQLAKFAHPFEGDYCDYRSFSGRTLILNELQVCHGVCAHHIHRPCKNLKKWLTHHPQNGVVLFVRGQSFIRFIQQCRHNRAMKPIAFGSLRAPPGAHESER